MNHMRVNKDVWETKGLLKAQSPISSRVLRGASLSSGLPGGDPEEALS